MVLYYNCFSGISGDMNLGAMIDLGVDANVLKRELSKLNISAYELLVDTDSRKGISGTKVTVNLTEHQHHHRKLKDIQDIVAVSDLSNAVKEKSLKIFTVIAKAEAKVHGTTIEEVHFHEVGAIDSIVDVVGAAICFEQLNISKVISSPPELGGGFVQCAHGKIPVPAPATLEILKGIPVTTGAVDKEMTTPTGAAILKAMVSEFANTISGQIVKTAYGIGQRDTEIPNVLRVMLLEQSKEFEDIAREMMLECNIDDMNPELYDFVFEKLFEKGALDVFITPIIMKKSRPANVLSVICKSEHKDVIKEIMFQNTSTLGIREMEISRTMLSRDFNEVETSFGIVKIKNAYYKGKLIHSKPEYDDCKALAKKHGVSIKEIYNSLSL